MKQSEDFPGGGRSLPPSSPPGGRGARGHFELGNTASRKGGRARALKIRADREVQAVARHLELPDAEPQGWQEPFQAIYRSELDALALEVATTRGMRPDEIPHSDLRLCQIMARHVSQYEMCCSQQDRAPTPQVAIEWAEKSLVFARPMESYFRWLRLNKTKEEAKRAKRPTALDVTSIPSRGNSGLPSGGMMPPPPVPPKPMGK